MADVAFRRILRSKNSEALEFSERKFTSAKEIQNFSYLGLVLIIHPSVTVCFKNLSKRNFFYLNSLIYQINSREVI